MLFQENQAFTLESGAVLPGYHLDYTTYGTLSRTGDNVIWIFHALTANSDPAEWWPGLVGPGRIFDPGKYYIVCVNMPGSCYGSIGPLDPRPGASGLANAQSSAIAQPAGSQYLAATPAQLSALPAHSTTPIGLTHSTNIDAQQDAPGDPAASPWYRDFPFFTPRDMARAYQPLRRFLGIRAIHIGIGGSMGGQQLLEWAILEPDLFRHIVPIATNAQHSSWGIAFNTAQRMAIETDPTFFKDTEDGGLNGMRAARATALLSYRHYDAYRLLQPRPEDYLGESQPPAVPDPLAAAAGAMAPQHFAGSNVTAPGSGDLQHNQAPAAAAPGAGDRQQNQASTATAPGPQDPQHIAPSPVLPITAPPARNGPASYQRYQGEKLARRFNAYSYYTLSLSMDAHDLGRDRGGLPTALKTISARTLVIGITTDILFPPTEQQLLAALIPGAEYQQISSLYGHDGFLLEYDQIGALIKKFCTPISPEYVVHHHPNI